MTGPSPVSPEPTGPDAIPVTSTLAIPRTDLQFRASRAGGPGGQHVNTSSTRVELLWDFEQSTALTDAERATIREKLAARIDAEGYVRVVASDSRSQRQNRERAAERLAVLVRDALKPRKARRRTRPPRRANEARLEDKKKRGDRKRDRRDDY